MCLFKRMLPSAAGRLLLEILVSVEDALECLLAGQTQQKTYIVQEGNDLWSIA